LYGGHGAAILCRTSCPLLRVDPMFRNTLVAGFAVLAVVALGSAAPQRPEVPKSSAEEPDFTGKVLSVNVSDPVIRGAVLKNVRIKRLGGRAFLTGDSIKRGPDDESPDAVFWFPVEDVKLIREYKSFEDWKKDLAEAEKAGKNEKQ
jgi:hypothetical protein